MFSVLKFSVTAIFLSSPSSGHGWLGFDVLASGTYWWGTEWDHEPDNGDTKNCVCVTGVPSAQAHGKPAIVNGVMTQCVAGVRFMDDKRYVQEWKMMYSWMDGNYPIDVTTTGSDGLWVDRFQIWWEKGGKKSKRIYGGDNTTGYCLSTDANEYFDRYATNGRCYQTLSLNPDGNVYDYNGITGYHKPQRKAETMREICRTAKIISGRRRMDGGEGHQIPTIPMPPSEAEDVTDLLDGDLSDEEEQDLDIDLSGLISKQSELQGQVKSALHSAIKQLVTQNSDVTDEQIDDLLNSVMLAVEEEVSGRAEREHELEGGSESDDGFISEPEEPTGSTPLPKQEREHELEGGSEPDDSFSSVPEEQTGSTPLPKRLLGA